VSRDRVAAIRERICSALGASHVDVIDESHLHEGHAGARDGRGHFRVRVVSDGFSGMKPLERHRLVYEAVGDLMQTDIHALSVAALTAEEAQGQ
jgi:BolA protein